jgi:hypothetical protein
MEQTTQTNGAPQPPMLQAANASKTARLVPFNEHQRDTIVRAFAAYMAVVNTVASCMGLKGGRLDNEQFSGFIVDE